MYVEAVAVSPNQGDRQSVDEIFAKLLRCVLILDDI